MADLKCNKKLLKNDEIPISRRTEKYTYTWTVHKVSECIAIANNDQYYSIESPMFSNKNGKHKWQLACFANNRDKQYISAYVINKSECEVCAAYILSAKNSDDETLYEETHSKKQLVLNVGYGGDRFFAHENVKNLDDDILRINAIISVEVFSKKNILHNFPEIKVSKRLTKAWKNDIGTDFKLKVDGFEIAVHKFILMAYSPVFQKMCQDDTLEKKEGFVPIADVDIRTLNLMVDFMYTGTIDEDLSYDEAKNLLYAADKYKISDLLEISENYLTDELNLRNAVKILLLAHKSNAAKLKETAIDYIVENRWKFLGNTRLREVTKQAPKLLEDLLLKISNYLIPCKTIVA